MVKKNMEIDIDVQLRISHVLIKLQKFEYLIHGIVAHFKEDILSSNRPFKKLNAEIFLSNTEEAKKKRKQTLGQILQVVQEHADFIYDSELDELLKKRNTFIHSFWRDFISKGQYNKEKSLDFLIKLENLTDEWTKVFRGFLSIMTKCVYNLQSEEYKMDTERRKKYLESFDSNDFEKYFYEKFTK